MCIRDSDTVTLTLDDDSELECIVLNIFKGGDREYIALLPTEGIEAEEGTVYLYRVLQIRHHALPFSLSFLSFLFNIFVTIQNFIPKASQLQP